jgi:hypothetical protein
MKVASGSLPPGLKDLGQTTPDAPTSGSATIAVVVHNADA